MKVKLLSEGAQLPTKATEEAAGYDLYVPKDIVVKPGRNIVPLDLSLAIPHGMEGQIRPRSGFSAKGMEGRVHNSPSEETKRFNADVLLGTIDSDYRGCVGVIINSFEKESFILNKGTRIAQLVIAPYNSVCIESCTELDETKRGEGGFGHTGTK